MPAYYEEVIEEIRELIADKKYQEACWTLSKELDMPYIPPETEDELKKLKRDLDYLMSENREGREPSVMSLLDLLKGDAQAQMNAVSYLCGRNLREYEKEIGEYLSHEPCAEAAALVIEALQEQKINEEFTLAKDGIEYTFFPDEVTPVAESEGFLKALEFLDEWLSNDHPDYYEMCRTLLIHECYVFLPLSYDASEAHDLAAGIFEQVSRMMDDGHLYSEYRNRKIV